MLIHEFDELMERKPFTPFTMITADGREVRVKSPEFAWHPPDTLRTVIVATGVGAGFRIIDLQHVTQFVVGPNGNGRSKRRRR
jgi:hypothetical protein